MTFISVNPQRRRRPLFASPNFDYLFQDLMQGAPKRVAKAKKHQHPAVNIIESKDDFRIELAVPGLGKEDIKIDLEKNILTVAAKKTVEAKEGEQLLKREFSYHEFSRNFKLPETIDTTAITASFEQGILSLVLAKKEEAKEQAPKKIEIK